MMTIRYTLAAIAVTVLLTVAVLILRPPEGSSYMSGQGAFILESVGFGIFFFSMCWLPTMIIGRIIGRKSLTESQKDAHLGVTEIAAVVFIAMIIFVWNAIPHH
jgi:ABC-type transport system involved in multi-copper enzyme maturation permease subunit